MSQWREEDIAHWFQLREIRELLFSLARCVLDIALGVDDENLSLLHSGALRIIPSNETHNVTLLVRWTVSKPSHERALLRCKCVVNRS